MAERCPGSTFIGKATLRGYKWQINQRHVANIVKVTEGVSSGPAGQADVVEGLVFSITDKDRRTLDRKEGIKLGVYERVVLNVFLERHPNLTEKKTAKSTAQAASPVKRPPPSVRSPAAEVEEIEAITYLSTKYAEDGLIRLEYVQRMENAIHDAVKLDVSRDFVERYLEPYINGDVYQPEEDVQEKPSTSNPSQITPIELITPEKGATAQTPGNSLSEAKIEKAGEPTHE
ncbi:AIG2-like family domain-containing protein [Penicillium canescens]|nr:AIG2-like family domain-containing protein [Penicillium canescens]